MTEYRFGLPGEEEAILDFINLVFSQSARPHHFDRLLPKVYAHGDFAPLHALAVTDGRIRGTVALLPLTVHAAGECWRGGYIGSVSVHEKARGEGHMKALMAMQLEEAEKRGYDFLALGGRRQRYGYFGFEKGAPLLEFSINAANVRHALREADESRIRFVPVREADDASLDALLALHGAQPLYIDRDRRRLAEILSSWEAEAVLVFRRDTGAFLGWLTGEKEKVSEIVLADWAFLPAVIKAWMKGESSCSVCLPLWRKEAAECLNGFAETCAVCESEMIRILNWPRMIRGALRLKQQTQALAPGDICLEIGGRRLLVSVKGEEVLAEDTEREPCRILTERQAEDLLFSPFAALTERDPLLRSWLPLPFSVPVPDRF